MARAIEVRLANSDDARALAELLAQLGYPSAPERVLMRLRALSPSDADAVFVAVEGNTPIGMLSLHLVPLFHRDGFVGRITALVVREDRRSDGVGAVLIQHCEHHARARGAERLEVTSGDQRTRAHAFYTRNGFQPESRRFTKTL
jgi:GNAT superfamily N-acetyltransferase